MPGCYRLIIKNLGDITMSCDICGRSSCTSSFHSIAEQERYEKVIEAFEKARTLRARVRNEIDAEEEEAEEE